MRLSRILKIIQTEVSIICGGKAEVDNADRGLNNSVILRKPNSIILLLLIPHDANTSKKQIVNTPARYGHDKYNIYLSMSKFDLDK